MWICVVRTDFTSHVPRTFVTDIYFVFGVGIYETEDRNERESDVAVCSNRWALQE